MPAGPKASPGAIGLSLGLGILALLFWALALATLSDLAGSDPAGNVSGRSNWCGNRFMLTLSADLTMKDLSGPSKVVAKY